MDARPCVCCGAPVVLLNRVPRCDTDLRLFYLNHWDEAVAEARETLAGER